MRFPATAEVVPGFVPEGLSILAGRPKVGKSWMALEMALGVSMAEKVLGDTIPESGDVLYAALEDTFPRLQRRIKKLLWPPRPTWPDRLALATQWRRLDEGGVEDIRRLGAIGRRAQALYPRHAPKLVAENLSKGESHGKHRQSRRSLHCVARPQAR